VDFGIAWAAGATTISHVGDILGSVKYMSSEQAEGERVGPESDLYSLGTVLYEVLTGRAPFEVMTPADVPAAHAGGPPRRPMELNPEVPEGIDAIVMKLLSRDPADRHGSAAELVADLRRVRDGMPPSPPRGVKPHLTPQPTHRHWRSTRPHQPVTGRWPRRRFRHPGGDAGEPPRGDERAQGGHQEVEVPAVKGLGKQAARRSLDKAGFQVAVRFRASSQENTDRVLEQSVAGGKKAKGSSKIVLTVGEGPGAAKVPDLVGLTYSGAEGKLEQAGSQLGGVEEVPSETVPAGIIAGQDPQAWD
jgi:hypothetical protein